MYKNAEGDQVAETKQCKGDWRENVPSKYFLFISHLARDGDWLLKKAFGS